LLSIGGESPKLAQSIKFHPETKGARRAGVATAENISWKYFRKYFKPPGRRRSRRRKRTWASHRLLSQAYARNIKPKIGGLN
jgi:hypothetical protein